MIAGENPTTCPCGTFNMKSWLCHVSRHSCVIILRLVVKRMEMRISGTNRGVTANSRLMMFEGNAP
jgi:hypothetical protein